VATDDLHAPLGLGKPAAGRPVVYSVAAAVLGIATAAVVIGAAAWYEPLTRTLPSPAPPQAATPHTPAATVAKPEPAAVVPAQAARRVEVPGTAPPQPPARPLPQVTGSIQPAVGLDASTDPSQDKPPAAPGHADRVITIIDGRSGARQEVRIPAASNAANAPLPDPGFTDLMGGRSFPSADEAPELPPQPPRTKPNTPQKRAKPGQTMSTNSASQAPLR
jgi:hypothetical protein